MAFRRMTSMVSGKGHLDSFQEFFLTVRSQIIYLALVLNDEEKFPPLIRVQ